MAANTGSVRVRQTCTLQAFLICALIFCIDVNAEFLDNLSYEDLPATLKSAPTLMVFTVNWCQHCKQLLPEIGIIAKAVKGDPDINVARVDGDKEPAIVQKFHVYSFPTVLYFSAGFSLKEDKEPEEFTDYRWAELMAEFVNNETSAKTIKLTPRKKFLDWRKKVPHNKGKQPRQRFVEPEVPTPHPEGLDPIVGADEAGIEIRDPIVLTTANFEEVVKNVTEAIPVYFYTKQDFMQSEFLIQWRQAASAYTEDDHVTLAMVNIERGDNGDIAKAYNITDTPAIVYFPRCDVSSKQKPVEECKKPTFCEECTDTDEIISFISEQTIVELGIDPSSAKSGFSENGDPVVLTDEEYRRLVKEGKIIPLNPNYKNEGEDGSSVAEGKDEPSSSRNEERTADSKGEQVDSTDANTKDEL